MSEIRERAIAKIETELTPKSPDQDSLGLTPSYDEDRGDLGLTIPEIQNTSRVLAMLLRQSGNSSISEILIGELKPPLEEQLGYAIRREEVAEKLAGYNQIKDKRRRALLGWTLGTAVAFTLGIPVVKTLGEAFAKADEEIRARKRAEKEALDKSNLLDLTPSAPSINGWRVKYPIMDPKVDYIESQEKDNVAVLNNGDSVTFSSMDFFGTKEPTYIYLTDHTKLDGNSISIMKVALSSTSGSIEIWALRDQPTGEIDTRVLIFENVKTQQVRYVLITKTKAQLPTFQVQLMKKVTR